MDSNDDEHAGCAWRGGATWRAGAGVSRGPFQDERLATDEAVAWIVWRYPDNGFHWADGLYPGASEWWHPDDVVDLLNSIAEGGMSTFRTVDDLPDWLKLHFLDEEIPILSMLGAPPGTGLLNAPEYWPEAARGTLLDFKAVLAPDPDFAAAFAGEAERSGFHAEPEVPAWMLSAIGRRVEHPLLRDYESIWKGAAELRRAVASGKVAAFGWLAGAEGGAAPLARIPPALLGLDVCLCPAGVLPCTEEAAWRRTERPPPIWTGVELDAADVLRVWTASSPDAGGMTPALGAVPNGARYAAACTWMRQHAERIVARGHKPKREPSVKECVEKAPCTTNEARAAWDGLPAEWKGHSRKRKADGRN